jgi:hypothetical protein
LNFFLDPKYKNEISLFDWNPKTKLGYEEFAKKGKIIVSNK